MAGWATLHVNEGILVEYDMAHTWGLVAKSNDVGRRGRG